VQEVRRYYPFAPFIGAVTRKHFEWKGYRFPKGRLVVLDLYGTNHDPRSWQDPDRFWPDRFRDWNGSPFNFVPQGGGDFFAGHRCAGEWITIQQLKIATEFLVNEIDYRVVPGQDLNFSMIRIPTLPKSGFILDRVHRQKHQPNRAVGA
jgi:fatty-acid peroxygenase